MSLVTISHQFGENVQVSFDKEALKLISKVSNHPLLSNEANWEMVTIVYKHESSSKRLVSGIKNDFSKTDDVRVKSDMSGGEVYELYKILISGQDRTPILSIKRDEIANASSMNLTLASNAPSITNIVWDSVYGSGNISQFTTEVDGGVYGGNGYNWATTTVHPAANTDSECVFVVDGAFPMDYVIGIRQPDSDASIVGIVKSPYYGICNYYSNDTAGPVSSWNNNGLNTIKIKKEAVGTQYSPQISITVNDVVTMVRPDLQRNLPFVPAVRTMGASQGTGVVSAYFVGYSQSNNGNSGGSSQSTYVTWSDWNNGPLSGDYTVITEGGVYGGWNQSWEWLKSSNISFGQNQSGSVTFVVNSMPYYFGFGMGFGGQPSENVGFVKHSGSDEIMINVFGYVPNTPTMALNPGQNTFKIEKVGNTEFKLYVNGTLFHTIENNTGNTFSASLRNRYTAQGTGLISAYQSS